MDNLNGWRTCKNLPTVGEDVLISYGILKEIGFYTTDGWRIWDTKFNSDFFDTLKSLQKEKFFWKGMPNLNQKYSTLETWIIEANKEAKKNESIGETILSKLFKFKKIRI